MKPLFNDDDIGKKVSIIFNLNEHEVKSMESTDMGRLLKRLNIPPRIAGAIVEATSQYIKINVQKIKFRDSGDGLYLALDGYETKKIPYSKIKSYEWM